MSAYFGIGDLVVDKSLVPYTIGLIHKISVNPKNEKEIIYELTSPFGELYWNEAYIIDGIVDGKTEVHRRLKN